jgi:2,3-diaminopropionate biosynthesis protein SbnA
MIHTKLTDIVQENVFFHLENYLTDIDVYVKMEHLNLAGSIKLKAANAIIKKYEEEGLINKDSKIIESSSGNLGVALAIICSERGYPFTCVTDPNVSPNNLKLMKLYGADVICANPSDGEFVKERLRIIKEIQDKDESVIWLDQYSNIYNKKAHFDTTAKAIHENIPEVDYIFIGVGSSGSIMGCIEYFKKYKPKTKIIAVDPTGSTLYGGKKSSRYIPGIGGIVTPPILETDKADDFIKVDEQDTLDMCHLMLKEKGWLIGGSTGTSLCAIKQYEDKIPKGSKVVILAPDFGTNYLDTIYNPEWCKKYFK